MSVPKTFCPNSSFKRVAKRESKRKKNQSNSIFCKCISFMGTSLEKTAGGAGAEKL